MFRHILFIFSTLVFGQSLAYGQEAATANAEALKLFEASIRPALVKHCYPCHSAKAGKTEGGLTLDSKHGIRTGGDRGQAVVPGDVDASVLFSAISYNDPDLQMPPRGKQLPASVVADFKRWIEAGAVDPRTESQPPRKSTDLTSARKFWAFRKPREEALPPASEKGWVRRDLDHFVLARLKQHNLAPSADADLATLLRRLHFDLVGLPPSPDALLQFKAQVDTVGLEVALEAHVDRLLKSPQFGERWGRHWLDVARFAESSGKETNVTFPHAWRYRDYVIRSMNADKPFDRFITEQLAGDLLPYDTDAERAELLIATGFLAVGTKSLNEMNRLQFLADVIDEQIDTTTRAIMASSVACARCHDHKFDPYSMEDYYALAGIFASTETYFGTSVAPGNQVGGDLRTLPSLPEQVVPNRSFPAARLKKLKDELESLRKEERDRKAAARKAVEDGKDPTEFFSLADALRILWRTGAIEGQLKTVNEAGQALPLAMGVGDRARCLDVPLLHRGEIARPGDVIPRRFPEVVELSGISPISKEQSGRLQLAQWLTHPDHPLTARVMVNRVWRHLVGAGIVRTVDNFGQNGERPSHPALLDHLAIRFVEGGWSIKHLIRQIVLSRTYRQASTYDPIAFERDPENRLLWRAHKRRLDAEAIRDAMLSASGQLDLQPPTSSLVATIGDKPISLIAFDRRVPADLDGARHRSVYLPVIRDRLPDVLDLFDFAEPSLVTGNRETTNVPLQALYLMNSSFVLEQAQALGKRLEDIDTREHQVQRAFQLCFSRRPDEHEVTVALEFLDNHAANGVEPSRALWMYCQALLASAEFRNLD